MRLSDKYHKYFVYMLFEFKMIGAGLATIALAGVGNGIGII